MSDVGSLKIADVCRTTRRISKSISGKVEVRTEEKEEEHFVLYPHISPTDCRWRILDEGAVAIRFRPVDSFNLTSTTEIVIGISSMELVDLRDEV